MRGRNKRTLLGLTAVAAFVAVALPGAAYAADTDGTADITAGSLTIAAPTTVHFAATLNGLDQTVNATQAIDVLDNRGSGAGWNVTLSATTFTDDATPAHTLATDSISDGTTGVSGGPTSECDSGVTCTTASNTVEYPVAITTAETDPTAVNILSADADTGLGGQTWTHTMHLKVPGNAVAGTYSSTWTYSVTTGP
jgi:hypothetical protein